MRRRSRSFQNDLIIEFHCSVHLPILPERTSLEKSGMIFVLDYRHHHDTQDFK